VQLDFVGQLRLVEKDFRDADATEVSDADDAGLGRHVSILQLRRPQSASDVVGPTLAVTGARSASARLRS
jgi:hypothetical protein